VRLIRRNRSEDRDPDELASKLMFTLGMNIGLLEADGLWTPELQTLQDEFDSAVEDPDTSDEVTRKRLAKLVGAVEAALVGHGIDHTSVLDVL
jgi:hypothetical protein